MVRGLLIVLSVLPLDSFLNIARKSRLPAVGLLVLSLPLDGRLEKRQGVPPPAVVSGVNESRPSVLAAGVFSALRAHVRLLQRMCDIMMADEERPACSLVTCHLLLSATC